ncbi:hypothetical protein GOBAR_AA10388 [Gossypium barbadense]|uniref:Leucine-rich repeat-containing N-terminal plant-type domain-containing protein n=1 Tax=Gossypium barbadense TaxID=3634 RepID=A0A2P5Y3X8_GOSBA|nr:hypothetical protein GOBAR_AA10388 [Gossypium barbadense]
MTTPLLISLFPFLLLIPALCFSICHANSNVLCIQSEREALLKFKNHLIDPSNNIHIPKFFGLLESLTYLKLSQAQFHGAISHNLGNLSKLQYLDLGGNNLKSKSLQWVSGLSFLQYLDLSSADLHKANDWVQVTFKLPSLLELYLSDCGLEDVPSSISVNSSKSLVILDLSGNSLSSVPKWIFSLHGLVSIDLSDSSLEGPIPDYFGNISILEVLDLTGNSLNSSIPNFFLSDNQLQGTISSAIGNLSSVTYLDLSENQLNGQIPLSIGQLSSLELFDVSENQLNGQIPLSIGELSSLELFDVSENQLNGTFPLSIGELSSLKYLDFGYNLLEGVVLETHFSNLTRLTTLAASHNRLRFEPNSRSNWVTGILAQRISDVMPTWFLNLPTQFEYLNLSSNQLRGEISYLNVSNFVDLSSNRFIGPLPRVLPTLLVLILSNNSFSGSLFELLCNSSSRKWMVVLYIDKNLISGNIPDCWNHWQELPSTLQNSLHLVMLDLSENHFSGSIPAWIGDKLSNLAILSLRSNNFDGHIPHKICDLQFLQNLDLAHNNISRVIPKCFNNLSAMATTNKTNNFVFATFVVADFFFLNALLVLKGREDEYGSTLGLVTSMDLSANSLTGEIPKEIGSLVGLLSLNFSGNLLIGNIPESIGNMELMESLDLSMNRLNGEIPPSFSNLNFLNHFNVSYNNLTGQIPTSTQLQSFDNLSYMGNHLCGPPLTKNCTAKGIPTDIANNGSSSEGRKVNSPYVSLALGFVMGFWGVVAPLFFIRSWRIAYYRKLDHIYGKLYVFWATMGM